MLENVKAWQYIVIAGPALILGMVASYLILKERIRALEALVMENVPVRKDLTPQEIANNLLGTLYDHK